MSRGLAREDVEKPRSWVERLRPPSLNDPRTKFDLEAQRRFLEHFAATGRHEESADLAGVCYDTTLHWRHANPDFKAAFQAAERRYKEKLRREIERRGVDGWEEPLYAGGVRVLEPVLNDDGTVRRDEAGNAVMRPATVRKFSDRLLEILAKRQDPEFRERVDLQGKVEASTVEATPSSTRLRLELERMPPEAREHLRLAMEAHAAASARELPSSTSTGSVGTRSPGEAEPPQVIDVEPQ